MAEATYLLSALVTGTLVLVVWGFVLRMEEWRRYEPAPGQSTRRESATDRPALQGGRGGGDDSMAAWTIGFLALAVLAGGGAVLLVSDAALSASLGGWVALVAVFGALLLAYLLWGTYSSARHRGLPSAQAALLSAWLFGSLVVAAIAAKLVFAL